METENERIARIEEEDANSAFQEIVQKYLPRIRAYILSRLGSASDSVDDLAQEAFVVAWERLPSYRKESDFWIWLVGIAHNLIRNHLRKLKTHERLKDSIREEIDEMIFSGPDAALMETLRNAQLSRLHDCVRLLKGTARDIVVRRYFKNEKVKDIAGVHETSSACVSTLLFRSREGLRKCMEGGAG